MAALTLAPADQIADAALEAGDEHGFAPLCVVVLDAGGHPLVVKRDERASIGRVEIATGKADGCLAMGFGGRELASGPTRCRSSSPPSPLCCRRGSVPVLVRDREGLLLGAVGISGDTSDNDETVRSPASPPSGWLPTRDGSRDDRMPR